MLSLFVLNKQNKSKQMISVPIDSTVFQLKQKIEKIFKIEIDNQRLYFYNIKLDNLKLLSQYKIGSDD